MLGWVLKAFQEEKILSIETCFWSIKKIWVINVEKFFKNENLNNRYKMG